MKENDTENIIILPNFNLNELSENLRENLSKMSLHAYYMEYDSMQEFMKHVIDPGADIETRQGFEEEGYDINYEDRNLGFYDLGPRPKIILQVLSELKAIGYDVRRAEQVFKEIARNVWESAPKYYETKPESEKIPPPENYDPNNPYPNIFEKDNLDK